MRLFPPQDPLKNKSIFSGSLFQYLEESKKWRSRFLYVGDSYNISLFESKAVSVNCWACFFYFVFSNFHHKHAQLR